MKISYRSVFIFLILILSLSSAYLYYTSKKQMIEELYSDFTPTMRDLVERKLSTIGCQPKRYYGFDKTICFPCSIGDACFSYDWVQREYGEKMNPTGKPFLLNFKEFNANIADFYYDGLASMLDCTKVNENTLSCVGNAQFLLEDSSVSFKLLEKENLPMIAEFLCDKMGYGKPSCKKYECSCSNFKILIGKVTGDVYYTF